MKKDRFLVILATYNGERYLSQLLESVFNQKDAIVSVFARDDGSQDTTVEILKKYSESHSLTWYTGERLGPAKSFLELLKKAEEQPDFQKYDYIALADQDDIWMPEKLACAGKTLKEEEAILYAGSIEAYTETGRRFVKRPREQCLYEQLVRNNVAGCTMVLTKECLKIVNSYSPSDVIMHDMWMIQVCSAIGCKVAYDSNPYIKYRIHEQNFAGASVSLSDKLKNHRANIKGGNYARLYKTVDELLNGYSGVMPRQVEEKLELLRNSDAADLATRKRKILKELSAEHFSTVYRKMVFTYKVIVGEI